MDFIEQLSALRQIYKNENAYYDKEQGMYLYRIYSTNRQKGV